jgi:predicted GIY-YIG superfamily endonuclease
MDEAIASEKQIKSGSRKDKLTLIRHLPRLRVGFGGFLRCR